MENESYFLKKNKDRCCGCGACVQVCKHNALKMVESQDGFLYPVKDQLKCIECGLCVTVCPYNVEYCNNTDYEQKCFIATTNKKEYYLESASIGLCTMLSDSFIRMNGVVFGAYLDESTWKTYHIKVDTYEGVRLIRNSKYLQSNIKNTYIEVRECLNLGRNVLFIGTPCQIVGLKKYLRKEYPSLYTIDIICHGTFSPKLMNFEINYWQNLFQSKISNFKFRSKQVYKHNNGGMVNFDIYDGKSKCHVERFAGSSPTYKCYAYSGDGLAYNLRDCCYTCIFRNQKRYGDLTIGDPWGISSDIVKNKQILRNGIIRSLYFVNSLKGEKIIEKIAKYLIIQEVPCGAAFKQKALLPISSIKPPFRDKLLACQSTEEYINLIESYFNCTLEKEHINFKRLYKKNQIKRMVKYFFRYIKKL